MLRRSGRVDLLEAALAEGADFSSQQVYLNAAEGGHVKMLQFAFDKGLALTERSVIRGALAAYDSVSRLLYPVQILC